MPPQLSLKSPRRPRPLLSRLNAVAKVRRHHRASRTRFLPGLRIGVVGGGCSGFPIRLQFENGAGMMDKTFDMEGLKVFVDATSSHVSEWLHR